MKQRVSDRRTLKLIRQWLTAGYMEEGLFHETAIGSPQGGVISPLLANIYLNYLDTVWEKQYSHLGTLVRYADDFVILCKTEIDALETIQVLKAVFRKLELSMNREKSKLVHLDRGKAGFDFLGFHHRRMPVLKKRRRVDYPLRSHPSMKAMTKMRARVTKETSPRNRLYWSPEQMLENLKPIIQGWRNYYASVDRSVSLRYLAKVDYHIYRRLYLYWRKKHKKSKLTPTQVFELYRRKGLKKLSRYGPL